MYSPLHVYEACTRDWVLTSAQVLCRVCTSQSSAKSCAEPAMTQLRTEYLQNYACSFKYELCLYELLAPLPVLHANAVGANENFKLYCRNCSLGWWARKRNPAALVDEPFPGNHKIECNIANSVLSNSACAWWCTTVKVRCPWGLSAFSR